MLVWLKRILLVTFEETKIILFFGLFYLLASEMKLFNIGTLLFNLRRHYWILKLNFILIVFNFCSIAEGVKAKVFIRAKPFLVQDRRYLRLQQLKMDFSVQNIRMGVENVRDSNAIIRKRISFYELTIT